VSLTPRDHQPEISDLGDARTCQSHYAHSGRAGRARLRPVTGVQEHLAQLVI